MKPIILIAVILCLWILVVVVPKSVFFKNERTPNDYYDVIRRSSYTWEFTKKNMTILYGSTKKRGYVHIYIEDPEYKSPPQTGIYRVPSVEVWDGKKWLHKGKWQEDFFKIAEGLKADQEAKDKAEKEAERKILEAYNKPITKAPEVQSTPTVYAPKPIAFGMFGDMKTSYPSEGYLVGSSNPEEAKRIRERAMWHEDQHRKGKK